MSADESTKDLINELSTGIADLVSVIEERKPDHSAIVDALNALTKSLGGNKSNAEIVAAIKGLRFDAPVIEFSPVIQPSEVKVVFPERADEEIDVKVTYDNFDRITNMRMRRVPIKK